MSTRDSRLDDLIAQREGGALGLFTGASGSGRRQAARDLAADIGAPLVAVDLGSVMTKYAGKVEQHLEEVFDDARRRGAVLFFDEADALFGKRSEVKDSHDRYANVETNYLLQQVEDCGTIVILAASAASAVDPKLVGRCACVVAFPPDRCP